MTKKDKSREELIIFVERLLHFLNLWTIYSDLLTGAYTPSQGDHDGGIHDPRLTVMLVVYAYFYSMVEDSEEAINAFRIWRAQFPDELEAINSVEAQVTPFKNDLRLFRNRLGFHGSRTRAHESKGFDFFGSTSPMQTWNAIKNFKALAACLLAKDTAVKNTNDARVDYLKVQIKAIGERAKQESTP